MMDKNQRILLVYITKVSGHQQATVAIQDSLKKLNPQAEVNAINGFGYTYPVLEQVVNKAYMGIIKRTPKVWDYLYDNPKIVKNSQSIKNFLHKTSHKKLRKLLETFQPDTVVCTQAFPCGMLADYKRSHNLDFKLIGVLTDYAPHSFWINEGVDYYIVPNEEAKDRFISKGVHADSIKAYGIPIRIKFASQLNKAPIYEKYGLNPRIPTILIMGGGQGLGPIKTIVKSLLKVESDLQLIILTGTNKKVHKTLIKYSRKTPKKMLVYDFVSNVDEFMEIASLIITKPGGMTTTECLAKGLPMIIINPIPGQEMRNTDFLVKKGIGLRIDDTNDIGEEVELLVKSAERLAAMRKAAYENAKPHAAADIARLILNTSSVLA